MTKLVGYKVGCCKFVFRKQVLVLIYTMFHFIAKTIQNEEKRHTIISLFIVHMKSENIKSASYTKEAKKVVQISHAGIVLPF